jgi:hypothetical protein
VVKAVDTSNNASGNSNQTSAQPTAPGGDTTAPGAPTGLGATAGNASAALSWTANTESDLAGYNVYRGTATGGPYTQINTSLVTGHTYADSGLTNGTTYYYVVKAVDTSNNASGNSNQASATPTNPGGGGGGTGTMFEAESMTIASGSKYTTVFNDAAASGGKGVVMLGADTITKTVTTTAGSGISVRALGDQCQGAPTMTVKVDNVTVFTTTVPATSWTTYSGARAITAGSHAFSIQFSGDLFVPPSCDRNLRVDNVTVTTGAGPTPTQLLPDLVQQPPTQMSITQSSASYRLGMNSAVENHGVGPLLVNGHRSSTATANMTADQVVDLSDGTTQTFPGIGSMIFYTPHNHWHYLGFDKYELRKTSDNSLVAPDQKMGFCLGDRYTPNSNGTRNENPVTGPFTFNNCLPGNTTALAVSEGISPGYGDEYEPQLEGQFIDVTGVPAGQYYVVHRTNSDSALKESNYNNDVASALVSLWPNGYGSLPGVTVLKTCPGTATCSLAASASPNAFRYSRFGIPVGGLPFQLRHSPPPDDPPLLVKTAARFYARQALQRIAGAEASRARLACSSSSRRSYRCTVSWKVNGSRYRGTLDISLPPRNRDLWWTYRANLVRKNVAGVKHLRSGVTRVRVPKRTNK